MTRGGPELTQDLRGIVRRMIARGQAGEGVLRKPGPTSIQLHIENMWLNIWEPVDGPLTCMPHTHQRGFTSTVLLGRLITERLTLTPDPAGEYEHYEIHKADDGRRMVYVPLPGRYTVTSTVYDQPAGTLYHCPPEIFHRVTQPELTMTFLQLWGEPEVPQFGLLPVGCEVRVIERYVSPEALADTWATVERTCALAGV